MELLVIFKGNNFETVSLKEYSNSKGDNSRKPEERLSAPNIFKLNKTYLLRK
jgi:hypothetical protein